ncbi:glycosyltransferase family 8 protein [Verrucomicrobiaceae bacterium R5-34]|nr:glycosyltransferase family 8 protein [Verrucomicrobiaceae bacterium R5-34]
MERIVLSEENCNKRQVAFCCDDNYAPYLGVTLASFIHNCPDLDRYSICIFGSKLSDESKSNLRELIHETGLSLTFLDIDDGMLPDSTPTTGHITITTYFRILLADLMPEEIDQVLYLDCDLLVVNDLTGFFETDLNDDLIAAVDNPGFDRAEELGMAESWGYFNAGVIVCNLKQWRKEQFKDKVFEVIERLCDRLEFWDQDALNVATEGRWKRVSPIYNLQNSYYLRTPGDLQMKGKDLLKLRDDAVITHFSSALKPWQWAGAHPMQKEYFKYLDMTKLRGFRPKPSGLKDGFLALRATLRGLRSAVCCRLGL